MQARRFFRPDGEVPLRFELVESLPGECIRELPGDLLVPPGDLANFFVPPGGLDLVPDLCLGDLIPGLFLR